MFRYQNSWCLLLLTFASIILLGIWVDSSRWSRWKVYNLINSGLSADGHFEPLLSRFGSAQSANYRSKSSLSFKYSSSELNFLTWSPKDKPWFMVNGSLIPNPNEITFSRLSLLPEDDEPWNDRIINQLMYIPQGYQSDQLKKDDLKKILLHFDKSSWGQELPIGQDIFLQDLCPVNTCEITFDNRQASTADAILFKDHYEKPKHQKPDNQIWILYVLECPLHTPPFRGLNEMINWTATYRHDSDIVAPYEKFVYYDPEVKTKLQSINYAQGKTKKVAWFVSNCSARNKRLEYAKELSKYIDVDIFGRCGKLSCSRKNADECFEMLDKDYKFYLSFENSNCRDYITEKFYSNGLNRKIIPITMGAHPEDYKRSSPANSYIHVNDFSSPKDLASYLLKLDANDTLYNQYFSWKGTGEFINTYFWCRLCSMLHGPVKPKLYENLADWWYSPSICSADDWL
ncbi:glycoprotein 3-alpha-L-fucosyltransferase A-like [Panonychus citri]|uniref:glycoprotein 3-alpha-L-fucosyltransferase A-like n=1 Tax=Panonychus citri TaxID=50023 RepID=UPI0023073ACD|nr:glycoprotein 3-alpha-L-fucosyltransferase A-like [Panonychus citri]